ncbi:MAG: hypothetical protein ACTSPB_08705 [Candidatus Thorarchaeota archaeon]
MSYKGPLYRKKNKKTTDNSRSPLQKMYVILEVLKEKKKVIYAPATNHNDKRMKSIESFNDEFEQCGYVD